MPNIPDDILNNPAEYKPKKPVKDGCEFEILESPMTHGFDKKTERKPASQDVGDFS